MIESGEEEVRRLQASQSESITELERELEMLEEEYGFMVSFFSTAKFFFFYIMASAF